MGGRAGVGGFTGRWVNVALVGGLIILNLSVLYCGALSKEALDIFMNHDDYSI